MPKRPESVPPDSFLTDAEDYIRKLKINEVEKSALIGQLRVDSASYPWINILSERLRAGADRSEIFGTLVSNIRGIMEVELHQFKALEKFIVSAKIPADEKSFLFQTVLPDKELRDELLKIYFMAGSIGGDDQIAALIKYFIVKYKPAV